MVKLLGQAVVTSYLKGEVGKEEWTGVEVEVVGWDTDPDNEVIVASPSDDLKNGDIELDRGEVDKRECECEQGSENKKETIGPPGSGFFF